jgi:uncharacterized protein (TIGR04552 family)
MKGGTRIGLKRLEDFHLSDLESLRLLLRGHSVIDWARLDLTSEHEIRQFLVVQEFDPTDAGDQARIDAIRREAIGFLQRNFLFPIPKQIANMPIEDLLRLASGQGHRQLCACAILKCMHIIHHLEGRELLMHVPVSDQELFQLVEEKVYRVIGSMLAGGFPITEFVGGRKNKDSLYTKLLSKQETVAAQIYDKLRFRVVTREKNDIFPVLQFLMQKLFPFNYVVPGQSINSLFNFRAYCEANEGLSPLLHRLQAAPGDGDFTPTDNEFSGHNYRVVHFVVDMPIRLPDKIIQRASVNHSMGRVGFVICEFQIVDRGTEASNELGDASHSQYKERQKLAVLRRLHLPESAAQSRATLPPPPPTEPPPASKRKGRS